MNTLTSPARAVTVAILASLLPATFEVGCAKLPNTTGLPRGAMLVTETPDYKAGFTAPDDGTIYIFHRGDPSYLRYSGPITKGQVFTIDPESNTAVIDNKPLEVTVPGGGNHYQVYFRPKSADMLDGK